MAYAYSDRLMPSTPPRVPPVRPDDLRQSCDAGEPSSVIEERLAELAALPEDWNVEGAPPISKAALQSTRQLLALRPLLIGLGELFPSPDGGVLLEYVRGSWDLTVKVSADGSLEIFGSEIDGTAKLLRHPYPVLNEEFLKVLDATGGPAWSSVWCRVPSERWRAMVSTFTGLPNPFSARSPNPPDHAWQRDRPSPHGRTAR